WKRPDMVRTRQLLLLSLLLLGGCTWPVREETDRTALELASQSFDLAPAESAGSKSTEDAASPPKESAKAVNQEASNPATDVQTVAFMQAERPQEKPTGKLPKYELRLPSDLPGAETPLIPRFDKMTDEQKQRTIRQLYPELPPLPTEATP